MFNIVTIGKDVFLEEPFRKVVQRMGWKLTEEEKNWLVAYPTEDEVLFDFIFGV